YRYFARGDWQIGSKAPLAGLLQSEMGARRLQTDVSESANAKAFNREAKKILGVTVGSSGYPQINKKWTVGPFWCHQKFWVRQSDHHHFSLSCGLNF
ncbi:MAG: hypothetical protein LBD28_00190, partial [Tannerellaceae bacterium]|nr:hypothetical protein [Tannerellaceae bacterium]